MSVRGARPAAPAAARVTTSTDTPALTLWLGVVAVAIGVVRAARVAWVSDDAFISFRYAAHLARGLGLVFNPGERVEGYTNFLWTVWTALGLRLGADAEGWAVAWGVACHGATIALLAHHARRRARIEGGAFALPLAALLAATLADLQRFATSGLETAAFTLLLVLGFVLLLAPEASRRSAAAAGAALALAAMTRPEGMLYAALAAGWLAWRGGRGTVIAFAVAFGALWVPYTLWRVSFYGDLLPNTFYAKSGGRAWWSQGWLYLRLYLAKDVVLALAVPAALAARAWARRSGPARDAGGAEIALALAFALPLMVYVTRVGGDFMFARLLIPATPFLLVLLERAAWDVQRRAPRAGLALAAIAIVAAAWTPEPLPGARMQSGILNEWSFYRKAVTDDDRWRALSLRPWFAGLPVRMAFLGGEARLVYYADPAVAIECETGLTDRVLARQPLARRGRIGHEKRATLDWLLAARGADVVFHPEAPSVLSLADQIPLVPVQLGALRGLLLHWNPALVDAWRRRGGMVEDAPAALDRAIAELPRHSDAEVAALFDRYRRFYFAFVPDTARARPLLARLAPAR